MLIQGISLLVTQDHRNFMLCVASNYTSPSSLVMYCYRQLTPNYASPISGEAYRDRRLTTNFEL